MTEEITLATAIEAYRGISFSPERRGEHFLKELAEHFDYIAQWAGRWRTDDNTAAMDDALAYYRDGYISKARTYLNAQSRCISWFITGPSGFPVERAQKANESANKRLDEWLERAHKQRDRIARQFNPAVSTIISADDEDAIAQLQAKRDRLAQRQERYKAANKICRRTGATEESITRGLLDLGFADEDIRGALHPLWGGKPGFEPFVLANNNANIRRVGERIKALEREAARRETTPSEYKINGVQVVEDGDDNRLKLFFSGKPPAPAVIASLKAHGFHWSPRQMCWMRQLNNNARHAMREVLQECAQ